MQCYLKAGWGIKRSGLSLLLVERAPLTAFPAWCVLLCSHSGHLLFFVWEAFSWGWEPGDKCTWFWMHLIWVQTRAAVAALCVKPCGGWWDCHFEMLRSSSRSGRVSIPVHRHTHVQTHLWCSWGSWSAAAASSLAPCHVHPCFMSLLSLFYDLLLTLAHAPSASGSCTGARPKPYGRPCFNSIDCPSKGVTALLQPFSSWRVGTGGQRIPPASLGLPGPGHMHMNGAVHLHLLQPLLHCRRSL